MQQSLKSFAYQIGAAGCLISVYAVFVTLMDPDGGLHLLLHAVFFGVASVITMQSLLNVDQRLKALESAKADETTDTNA